VCACVDCCAQLLCPDCGTYKTKGKFQRHSICRDCQASALGPTIHIVTSISRSSFQQFFDQESTHGARLSFFQRSALVTLWQLNLTVARIQEMTGCDPRTITQWTDQYAEHRSLEDEPRSGRSRVTTAEVDQSIVGSATANPFTTPRQITAELGLGVSNRTTRRRLDEAGLLGREARIEHPFTAEDIAERLAFAREYETWSDDRWDRVIFGDEGYIYLGVHGQVWVQRPADAAYLKEYMVPGQLQFPPKVGVFACFTSQGVGDMRIIYDDMDERLYTDTMARTLKPSALRVFPSGPWQYLHDNASYHTGRASYTWFHNNGVDCIKLPPHSPDLNPIENLFNYWKRRVEARRPRNTTKLTEYCLEEWANIPLLMCSILVDSMRDRMRAVIDAEGHKSGY
jgi:transposase